MGGVRLLGAMALGALLLALVYQIPAAHDVDIGGYDAAYVQGFYDPERSDAAILAGSDGRARWTRDVSYLLFPQAGLPAQVTLRLRGRPTSPPAEMAVLLHTGPSQDTGGARELGRVRPGVGWQDYSFIIDDGLLKPNDVVIELRTIAAPPDAEDLRPVGVLLDHATYRTGAPPIAPYPAQLIYGALAAGMLYLLVRRPTTDGRRPTTATEAATEAATEGPPNRGWWLLGVGLLMLGVLFLVLYRLQPPYPHPLRRLLPMINLALAALLALRYGPAAAQRVPALLDGLALGGIGLWIGAILLAAQDHVTLSIPGVENDFGVFVRRSAQLAGRLPPGGVYDPATDGVLRADGFYNLGYPLLLWIVRPVTHDNPFLAARLIAALSGALLLGAAWWLARRLLGRGPALFALLLLAFSPFVVEYGLYLGSDMPFAALCMLALALILAPRSGVSPLSIVSGQWQSTTDNQQWTANNTRHAALAVLAGLVAGAAFLVRHPGLLLLPFGWLAFWPSLGIDRSELRTQNSELRTWPLLLFTLAFLIAIAPQLFVNIRDTGQPLYSQQAKNIWLCAYGSCDWGRWDEAPNNVTLSDVALRDPGRFLASWWANVRGFVGTGGEDTSEFGRAIQLRLLGFPANWLALAGLLGWLYVGFWILDFGLTTRKYNPKSKIQNLKSFTLLLVWIVLYVVSVSVGIALPRFFLPLAPVYALAAAWTITRLEPRTVKRIPSSVFRGVLTHHASRITHHASGNIQLIAAVVLLVWLWSGFATGTSYVLLNQPEDEAAAVRLVQATLRPGERVVVRAPPRVAIDTSSAIAHLVAPEGGQYLLTSDASPPVGGASIGTAGRYTLYRIAP
jgi:4-amino-4-deoxy-L-arabinose transferase-like glycosyltransferase